MQKKNNDHFRAIYNAMIASQGAQLATLAWLMAVGRTHGPQLVSELKAEHAKVKASQAALKELRSALPKRKRAVKRRKPPFQQN